MARARVAVLKTTPETILEDYAKLLEMAEVEKFLAKDKATILKENISWHFLYPGANTTPWQLEGTIRKLKSIGFDNLVAVSNETVVTNAFKGEKLNKFDKVFDKYSIPIKYNFLPQDMKWIRYEPKSNMHILPKIYPKGIHLPEYFIGKNIIHLPTMKTHIYTTTTRDIFTNYFDLFNPSYTKSFFVG